MNGDPTMIPFQVIIAIALRNTSRRVTNDRDRAFVVVVGWKMVTQSSLQTAQVFKAQWGGRHSLIGQQRRQTTTILLLNVSRTLLTVVHSAMHH